MAVSEAYLTKGMQALKRSSMTTDEKSMLKDVIEMCRADMIAKGLDVELASDESDYNVLGCVRSYIRAQYPNSTDEKEVNMSEYRLQLDELRKSARYV